MHTNDPDNSLGGGGTFAGTSKPHPDDLSLGDAATFAGSSKRRSADTSLGDERTLGGGDAASIDTVIDDIEVVDLAARYKIEGTLGRGGMGEVLLATDTRLARKVAIKRILGEAARSKTAVSRFLTEAKAIAALNHPNVVQIYDYGRAADGPFLIMEYVDGTNLLDRCRAGALPLDLAVDLACQLCDGLAKAHDLGIVHRDIKPANVLLTKDGLPKLTDFGLAKAETGDHQMTMTGAVLGTPDFMPPEQRRDASLVDARSDIWSMAATIYQMVTGRSPKIIRFDLVPPSLTRVLSKALEDAKEDRYSTARELSEALRTSLAVDVAATPIGEGQCPACGVKNESSRRFCRGCGESLEAPCLSCAKPMPMWEEICGQCGMKQGPLLESRKSQMAASQAKAESLLKDFHFDEAERLTAILRDESDPRLQQFSPWATRFSTHIADAKARQLREANAKLTEALKHEESYDYAAAIHALEQVPPVLRKVPSAGRVETTASVLARVTGKRDEVLRLETTVKERISARQISGLLPIVEKLRHLRPDRADVQTLCSQLEQRQLKLAAQRDEAVRLARSHIDATHHEAALEVLRNVDPYVVTPDVEALRSTATSAIQQLQMLLGEIRQAISAKHFDGLIRKVECGLALKPGHAELTSLLDSLRAREAKVTATIVGLIAQAEEAFAKRRFKEVLGALQRIPEKRRTANVIDLLESCEYLTTTQASALEAVETMRKVSDCSSVPLADLVRFAGQGRTYLAALSQHGLGDPLVEECCTTCEAAAEKRRAQDQRSNRLRHLRETIADVFLAAGTIFWGVGRAARRKSDCGAVAANAIRWVASGGVVIVLLIAAVMGWLFLSGRWRTGTIYNSVAMELVPIPAGNYVQKIKRVAFERDEDQYYRVKVQISQPFHMARTEVTKHQWWEIMKSSPWTGRSRMDRPAPSEYSQPATHIRLEEARTFCERLTEVERRIELIAKDRVYAVPTETEWEYAAAAGATTTYYGGNEPSVVASHDWCQSNSGSLGDTQPRPVAQKPPTSWGLFDVFGNVREICTDYVRGGCWKDEPVRCAIIRTNKPSPNDGDEFTGFRVILRNER